MSTRIPSLLVLGTLVAVSGSCASDDGEEAFSASKMKSQISGQCEATLVAALRTLHAAKACNEDADCAFRESNGIIVYEFCRAGSYVNPSAPELSGQALTTLEQQEEALAQCFLPKSSGGIGCMSFPYPPPDCWHGRCWIDVQAYDIFESSPDQCSSAAPPGTCGDCLCGNCPRDASSCFSDPDCLSLYECTLATGAFGRYAVLDYGVAHPPCPDILAKVGGPTSPAVERLMKAWQCSLSKGCFAVCDG
ncbi:MAG TPA: hypothetical protein PKA88_33385 [Polyangiaceae bacterium]|nr:hypothetical protein [Polyangiaceae bacterium]HMR77470.1 hypothetical protein [Polyangiaceae bacterium]